MQDRHYELQLLNETDKNNMRFFENQIMIRSLEIND
jgi:hypothetical protein